MLATAALVGSAAAGGAGGGIGLGGLLGGAGAVSGIASSLGRLFGKEEPEEQDETPFQGLQVVQKAPPQPLRINPPALSFQVAPYTPYMGRIV